MLKYLRRHPVPRLTIAGGVGKLAKLADGHLDLHSGRSQVDHDLLAALVVEGGGSAGAGRGRPRRPTPRWALCSCASAEGLPLGDLIADRCPATADGVLRGAGIAVDIVVIDRAGTVVGRA